MKTARDLMQSPAPSVAPTLTAKELYIYLAAHDLDGTCVVDGGRFLGVVTSMDLVFKETKVHMPTFFYFLDAVIPLSNPWALQEEAQKISGSKVIDFATTEDVVTVKPDTPLSEVASLMVDRHITVLPVLDGKELVGMVSKADVLRAAFG